MSKIKILVVEDDKDLREAICDILSVVGYAVIQAENGKVGIALAKLIFPDLILSDIMMPEMNGLKLLEMVRKTSKIKNIPFIFLTVKNEEDNILEGLKAGAQDYVTKPFNNEILLARIKIHLDLKNLYDQQTRHIQEISHNLRNAMAPVIGYSSVLLDDKYLNESYKKIVKKLDSAAKRVNDTLTSILNDLKDPHEKKKQKFDATELVKKFIDTYQIVASDMNKKLYFEGKIICMVNGYNNYLGTAIENLVKNAFIHSKSDKVWVSVYKENSFAFIAVTDEGKGLSKEEIDEIYAGKSHIGNKPMEGEESHGIGLVSVRKVMEDHGGELLIKSEPGKGSTFTLKLPLATE